MKTRYISDILISIIAEIVDTLLKLVNIRCTLNSA